MGSIKIVGIAGSPRRGNTELLVKEALKAAESIGDVETEFISLAGKRFNPVKQIIGAQLKAHSISPVLPSLTMMLMRFLRSLYWQMESLLAPLSIGVA